MRRLRADSVGPCDDRLLADSASGEAIDIVPLLVQEPIVREESLHTEMPEPASCVEGRVGLLVAQLGGPRDQSEVEGFIRGIFTDPDTVPIRGGRLVRAVVGTVIAKARAPFVRRNYRLIGGGSPIGSITESQARSVETELRRRGHDVVARVAMRNSRPGTTEAVRELVDAGVERFVLFPLYPQYSVATTGSSEKEARRVVAALDDHRPIRVLRSWHDHAAYVEATAALLAGAIESLPAEDRDGVAVLVSAHGLPAGIADKGDPYPAETRRTIEGVLDRVPYGVDARLGYQSRTGPLKWIGPGTEEVIDAFAAEGRETLIVLPISFVSDHFETLYETDILFRDRAVAAGIQNYVRVPVFNDRPEVGSMLADVIEPLIRSESLLDDDQQPNPGSEVHGPVRRLSR